MNRITEMDPRPSSRRLLPLTPPTALHQPTSELSLGGASATRRVLNPTATAAHNHHLSSLRSLRSEERGLRLIQILQTCAAHAAASDLPRGDACLHLIATLSSRSGDSMQRLAAFLGCSLAARLLRDRWTGILSALHPLTSSVDSDPRARLAFARALPYLPFAHAVIGRVLLRALVQEPVVHLVDLGGSHASVGLWTPLIRALSCLPRGIKLTCISKDPSVLESIGSALAKEAEALNVSFQFNPVNSSLRQLGPNTLRARPGEAIAVASVLTLHQLLADGEEEDEEAPVGPAKQQRRRRRERIDRFLAVLRSMSPKVVAVMEQESDHNSGRMEERFAEALHYYSAMFDSVESAASGGMLTGEERVAVEEMLGREMENVIACEGEERVERHEKAERWVARMVRAGFRQWGVWSDAGEEGRKVVESWPGKGRYGVAIYYSCPMICWHGRPLYAVSAWQCI